MAKKVQLPADKTAPPRRTGKKTPDDLYGCAVKLERLAGEFRAIADDIRAAGLDAVVQTGWNKADRAFPLLLDALKYLEVAVKDAKRRQEFGV